MELYKELLAQFLSEQETHIFFPNLKINATEIIRLQSYQALQKIKEILYDDSLNDEECFIKIEKIISVFEQMEICCGTRHDFG